MTKIGLCMIVKDEEHVILRCLESVKRFVDFVLIQDTGSSDHTVQKIEEWLEASSMPGEVRHEKWRDFATNRSIVLGDLRKKEDIDYAFIMDADDVLLVDECFNIEDFKSNAKADLYSLLLTSHGLRYRRDLLCSNSKNFSFKGVLHEYLESPPNCKRENIIGLSVLSGREGARSKDPLKYAKDADVLKLALETEQDPFLKSRYCFYAGQSLRDAGIYDEAIIYYRLRAGMNFWIDERFISLLEISKILIKQEVQIDSILTVLDEAIEIAPHRAEAHYEASRLCRLRDRFALGTKYADRGLLIEKPADGLFIADLIYKYGLLDELSINSYWNTDYAKCIDSCLKLLAVEQTPQDQKPRIITNLQHAWREHQKQSKNEVKGCKWSVYGQGDHKVEFNICQVMINRHGGIFEDTINSLTSALRDLGYQVSHTINSLKKGAVNIVLGSIAFAVDDQGNLDFVGTMPYIIYQQEQLSAKDGYLNSIAGYKKLLEKASHIFEYSPSGFKVLKELGFEHKTSYIPPIFHPILESYRPSEKSISDVVLYGSWTQRRQDIIDKLISKGVQARYLQGVYGDELKHAIAGSRIVINVHATAEIDNLETVRLAHLLANRSFVISEASDHNPYGGGVVFCSYDRIVDTALYFLHSGEAMRTQIADQGYENFRKTDLVKCLRETLSAINMDDMVA